MGAKAKPELGQQDLRGFKYFGKVSSLLEQLHRAACDRDKSHNRRLHMDQYLSLLLLVMYSPVVDSLRAVHRASALPKVKKKLNVPYASMGSLSEAARVFDADLLIGIIGKLAAELKPIAHSPKLNGLGQIVTAVDGTLLKGLPRTVQALWIDEDHKAYKAHVHYEILKGVPVSATVTDANANEKADLAARLEAGRLYVSDQGYAKYGLMQEIIDADSSFVTRIPDNACFEVVQERELEEEALAAEVVRDAVVGLGSHGRGEALRQPVRIIQVQCVQYTAKTLRNRRTRLKEGDTMLLATDRLDLPADVIAFLYLCRWEIEIFFRFLKHLLGCRHLLSYCQNGIELQVYAALIACLLIALYTGGKPNKAMLELTFWYIIGLADEQDVMGQIARLKKQS